MKLETEPEQVNATQTKSDCSSVSAEPDSLQTASASSQESDRSPAVGQRSNRTTTRWLWNWPLFIATLVGLLTVIPALYGLYVLQSGRVGRELRSRAAAAQEEGDLQSETKWLERYIAIRPEDTGAHVRLALAIDQEANLGGSVDRAQRFLARAIVQLGVDGDQSTIQDLRHRKIERLLELGGEWNILAESNVIQQNAREGDPTVSLQLARSMFGQASILGWRLRDSSQMDKDEDGYWKWLAYQPVGDILGVALEANPKSVELIGDTLYALLVRPELFNGSNYRADTSAFRNRAMKLVEKLRDQMDDARAQWLAFEYGRRIDGRNALGQLPSMSDRAMQRLQSLAEKQTGSQPAVFQEEKGQNNRRVAAPNSSSETKLDRTELVASQFDLRLVLAHIELILSRNESQSALEVLTKLHDLPNSILTAPMAEQVYAAMGGIHRRSGHSDIAWEVWQSGVDRISSDSMESSLSLRELLAATKVREAELSDAGPALAQLQDGMNRVSNLFKNVGKSVRSQSGRITQNRMLELLEWRFTVLRAEYLFRVNNQKDYSETQTILKAAVVSQLPIEPTARAEAYKLLAQVYSVQSLWDQAASALDASVLLVPDDKRLRLLAGDAWMRASDPSRAVKHFGVADDGTYERGLAYAQALLGELRMQPPSRRDDSKLRALLNDVRTRLEKVTSDGKRPTDGWRLDALATSLGESDKSQAAQALQRLQAWSERNPEGSELQSLLALKLDANGQSEAADALIDRYASSVNADPVMATMMKARLLLNRKEVEKALELFRQSAKMDIGRRNAIIRESASLLESVGQRQLARELLLEIPVDQRNTETLMQLGKLLLSIRSQSLTSDVPMSLDTSRELDNVVEKLRELEDYKDSVAKEGTLWRWLSAQSLIQGNPKNMDADQRLKDLRDAGQLASEILSIRPYWYLGLALAGQIKSAQNQLPEAADLYRKALAAGDGRLETIVALVLILDRLDKPEEAEREFERIAHLSDSIGHVSALGVGLAENAGDLKGALEMSEGATKAFPKAPKSWLIHAQAAATYAESLDSPEERTAIYASAANSIGRANELIEGKSPIIWLAMKNIHAKLTGSDGIRRITELAEKSRLPLTQRLMFAARSYMDLRDLKLARIRLDEASQNDPNNVAIHLAFADLHRLNANPDEMIKSLESAHKLDSQRGDIRRRLAMALAESNPTEATWKRIADLIGTSKSDATDAERIQYAVILALKSNDVLRLNEAEASMRKLKTNSNSQISDDASRLLGSLLRRKLKLASTREDTNQTNRIIAEIRGVFDYLTRRPIPNPSDVYRYADFLLDENLAADVPNLADTLQRLVPTSPALLNIRLRFAVQNDRKADAPSIVKTWLEASTNTKERNDALIVAGRMLSQLGLGTIAIDYLKTAYEKNPKYLRAYVNALAQAGDLQSAGQICIDEFARDPSAETITLLADVAALLKTRSEMDARIDAILAQGQKVFSSNARVLESLGGLRLTQKRYAEAVELFQQVEKMEPDRLLTLNNLAMTLSEIDGRESEGIPYIERAIKLKGRLPDFLDTLGVLQFRTKQLAQAEKTLRDAVSGSSDPRFGLHLLQVLKARGDLVGMRRAWNQLDIEELYKTVLTPNEVESVEQLRIELGQPIQSQPESQRTGDNLGLLSNPIFQLYDTFVAYEYQLEIVNA